MTEKSFVKKLEESYISEGFFTKKELGVGYGVADLVLFRPDFGNCLKRLAHKQFKPLLNEAYFCVFNLLPDADKYKMPMSFKELKEQTDYSSSFLKYQLIKNLKKARYVKETSDGYYFKVNGWLPVGKELIAIEAKLKDWKRGFYQANRYKTFADQTYLAVPPNTAKLVDHSLLIKQGVGLISFDAETGKKKILVKAEVKKALSESKRNFATEFFWNRSLIKSLTCV
ncbi:MAG: hypothetical protein WC531_01130 [Candidatus Paceibacterota bacterium]|jgi:hypothetical protein